MALPPEAHDPPRTATLLLFEHDCREAAPISAFPAQATAPIAEEKPISGNGAARNPLHDPDPGTKEPVFDIARQVEHEMTNTSRCSEVRHARRIRRVKALRELGSDLVGVSAYARAY